MKVFIPAFILSLFIGTRVAAVDVSIGLHGGMVFLGPGGYFDERGVKTDAFFGRLTIDLGLWRTGGIQLSASHDRTYEDYSNGDELRNIEIGLLLRQRLLGNDRLDIYGILGPTLNFIEYDDPMDSSGMEFSGDVSRLGICGGMGMAVALTDALDLVLDGRMNYFTFNRADTEWHGTGKIGLGLALNLGELTAN
ncbi:hypothetical protein JW905_09315 [bacterium]|nr:hypothetical protein [candidate division CSSED10-310 bacterium]